MACHIKNIAPPFFFIMLGASLALAFAPFNLFPLAIFSPIYMLHLQKNNTPKQAFLQGWFFGVGMFTAGIYWLYTSIHQIGNVPVLLTLFIVGALISFLALYPATVYGLTARFFKKNNTAKIVLAFPAFWVLSEWVRTSFLGGFPWLYLGYSQISTPLRGFAPVLGVYGVSFVVLLSGSLILNAIYQYQAKKLKVVCLNLFLCFTLWISGAILHLIHWTHPVNAPIKISLVQGNISQSIKWSPEHIDLSYRRYTTLTQPLWGKNDLIIWPETAIPVPLQDTMSYIEKMNETAKKSGSTLLLGIPIQASGDDGYYNALITLGKYNESYRKRILVPFGEYTPFRQFFKPFADYLNLPMSELLPGESNQNPLVLGKTSILPAICFEIAFPEFMNTGDPTVGMILTITNDAWFGKSTAEAEHFQIARMRALELQRPVLFVGNNGLTGVINPDGSVAKTLPPYQTGVLSTTVTAQNGLTPWMQFGTNPILALVMIFLYNAFMLTYFKSHVLTRLKLAFKMKS